MENTNAIKKTGTTSNNNNHRTKKNNSSITVVYIDKEEDITDDLKSIMNNSIVSKKHIFKQNHTIYNINEFVLYTAINYLLQKYNTPKHDYNNLVNSYILNLLGKEIQDLDKQKQITLPILFDFHTTEILMKFHNKQKIIDYTKDECNAMEIEKNYIMEKIKKMCKSSSHTEEISQTEVIYPKYVYGALLLDMILIIKEKTIVGYIHFEIISEKDELEYIYIYYVEVHPKFRGLGLCNKLINLLINNPNFAHINKYKIENAGGLIAYKCYVNTFKTNGFKPSYFKRNDDTLIYYNATLHSNNNIKTNTNSSKKKTLNNNNNNNNNNNTNYKYNGMLIFTKSP
jgi:hypothetical protein